MSREKTIKQKAKVIKSVKRVTLLVTLIVIGYGGTVLYSVLQMDPEYENILATGTYVNQGTNTTADDAYFFSLSIPINNEGFYAYDYISFMVDLIIPNCAGLANDTRVGSSTDVTTGLDAGESTVLNVTLNMTSNPDLALAIASFHPDFEYRFSVEAKVHSFRVFFEGAIPIPYETVSPV